MLQYLKISNLALLEQVVLEFEPGFIAVTGETGAGKSVLLGALSLLSGARADKSLIRKGADALEVEAIIHFEAPDRINSKLESLGLPPTEEGALILRRTIPESKAARILINGSVSTLSNLTEIGESWIDFHGPGEPQKLFSETWQLALLDLYGKLDPELSAYRKLYRQWRQLLNQKETIANEEELSNDERDFISQQIKKIDQARLSPDRIDQLERDYTRMSQAQELLDLTGQITQGIESENGLIDQFQQLIQVARELADIDSESRELSDRLESSLIEIQDIADSYHQLLEAVEFDKETIDRVEKDMDQWIEIKRKYGSDVATILQKRDQMKARIQNQSNLVKRLEDLDQEISAIEKKMASHGETLRLKRMESAKALSKETAKRLQKLGFKKADLSIEIMRENNFTPTGNSSCQFQFSPNAGQELMPLNKIASSGELARVMLALKTVLAEVDHTPVLVFDEVDSNIGGEIATVVGKDLARLGKHHQVFCITHLAQVAASASTHFVVEKSQSENATQIEIAPIHSSQKQRLDELARMIGDRNSPSAKSHAKELLASPS